MEKKSQHNPAISIVPYPPKQSRETRKSVPSRHPHHSNPAKHARTEQRRKKISTAPPPTPAKGPNILVPARHSTQRRLTQANMYVTQPARKIPTSPIDPIKEDGTRNFKYTHTDYRDNNEQENENFHHSNTVLHTGY